ncbi:MAG: hypothetical protein MJ180_03535 [Candidatus Gastranaerophilales bacterium]|nr:hypothetical protein [Candidatus Gastranaerophilales bacterium]
MSIVVNTNVTSLKVQQNLNRANAGITQVTERLTTGFRINHAADDAAGLSISQSMLSQVNGTSIAQDNTQHGINLLQTAEGDMSVIQDHLQSIRDLTVQAANGTYSTAEKEMISREVLARFEEITRLANVSKFSDIPLLSNDHNSALVLQIGANSSEYDRLDISDALIKMTATALNADFTEEKVKAAFATSDNASAFIQIIDNAIDKVSQCRSRVGAYQNRIDATMESLVIREQNLSASLSELRDADIAKEAAELTKQQILQQTSAALLSQANSNPTIALQLLQS